MRCIVLSDDDDAKAPAPADKFPDQFEAYLVRNLACQWSTAPSRPSCSTGRVNSMESSTCTSLVVATSKSQQHCKVTGAAAA
mmetsp:Transcript_51121/g.114939  ORF Transcript_51121/g.114939 Transcript_51121/m.114939 type:complete len:82 (-) Transcript_51121:102-347(-)